MADRTDAPPPGGKKSDDKTSPPLKSAKIIDLEKRRAELDAELEKEEKETREAVEKAAREAVAKRDAELAAVRTAAEAARTTEIEHDVRRGEERIARHRSFRDALIGILGTLVVVLVIFGLVPKGGSVDLGPLTAKVTKVEGDIASLTTKVDGKADKGYVDSVKTELDKSYADALRKVATAADDAKAAAEKASADAKEAADAADNLRGELIARKAGGEHVPMPPRRPAETTTPASTSPSVSGDDDEAGAGEPRRVVAFNNHHRGGRPNCRQTRMGCVGEPITDPVLLREAFGRPPVQGACVHDAERREWRPGGTDQYGRRLKGQWVTYRANCNN